MNITKLLGACACLCCTLLTTPSYSAAILYGVTGDGANTPETLYTLDLTDGTQTFAATLGNGEDGETLAYNPNDNMLYHWSGFDINRSMETINPTTLAVSPIALSGDETQEVHAAAYNPLTNQFTMSDLGKDLYNMTSTGTATRLCTACLPFKLKGMAFIGSTLYGASANDNKLWTLDPVTGAILSTTTITLTGVSGVSDVGLSVNPDTNELWGILRTTSFDTRLVTLDVDTGQATLVGILGDKFSGIAFVPIAVPLPPALLLFGFGLLGIIGIGRKCRSR